MNNEFNLITRLKLFMTSDLIYSDPKSEETKLTDEQVYCVAACVYRDYGIVS